MAFFLYPQWLRPSGCNVSPAGLHSQLVLRWQADIARQRNTSVFPLANERNRYKRQAPVIITVSSSSGAELPTVQESADRYPCDGGVITWLV
jgi:hypothetical protein